MLKDILLKVLCHCIHQLIKHKIISVFADNTVLAADPAECLQDLLNALHRNTEKDLLTKNTKIVVFRN